MNRLTRKAQDIADVAAKLFARHGWMRLSVETLCASASVSRVTFYKHFANKNALLRHVVIAQKEEVRQAMLALQARAQSLEEVVRGLFALQKASLETLYSAAFLSDIESNQDEDLKAFFQALEAEKYGFMTAFFHDLQARGLIRAHLPPALIQAYLQEGDRLFARPDVQSAYPDAPQQLRKDVLHLLIYGLSAARHEEE